MTSVYEQAINCVIDSIQSLGLTGLTSADVIKRKVPWDDMQRPARGITVSPQTVTGDGEIAESLGTNCRDDIGYPIYVTFVKATGKGWTEGVGDLTEWRQRVWRKFHRLRLDNFSEVGVSQVGCIVQPSALFLPTEYAKENLDVCQLLIRAWFRETRT